MLALTGAFLFVIVFWISKVDGQYVAIRFIPVTNKPSASGRIFNIRSPTVSQCIYLCMLNAGCLTVVYDNAQSVCSGYRSQNDDERLSADVKAWKAVYTGEISRLDSDAFFTLAIFWHALDNL